LQSSEPAASSQNPLRTDVAVQEPAASAPLAPRYPPSEPRLASPLPAYSPAAAAPVPSAGGGTWGAAPPASPMGTAAAGGKAGTYVVQPNDTFWSIAQQVYGSGTYYQALAEYNRRRVADPNRLRLGEAIATPALADLEKAFPELCPNPTHRPVTDRLLSGGGPSPMGGGRVYVVQEGDNLYEIARYELGKAARWVEIYDLNRDQLGNQSEFLAPGMKLLLPGDAAPDAAVTQRPGARYQR